MQEPENHISRTRRDQDDGEGGFWWNKTLFNQGHRTTVQDQTPHVRSTRVKKAYSWAERRDAKRSTSGVPHRRQRAATAKRSGEAANSTDEPRKRDRASAHRLISRQEHGRQIEGAKRDAKAKICFRKGQQKGDLDGPGGPRGQWTATMLAISKQRRAVPSRIGFVGGREEGPAVLDVDVGVCAPPPDHPPKTLAAVEDW
ncbi:hypothetical protein GWK47_005748 [Chionoecetes opilio]|uniref:Uncharacterized protein n=1 Tax=Chionoecetes opilio TaxID=41210 RepID=A0A8J4YGZ0_CHIOP|nr:hypothetical protein GWK47_005748 [Chionoecetes opilio]